MARQRLGQHYLHREPVLERIALAACPSVDTPVLEIGPGRGALTAHLLLHAPSVVGVELDEKLARYLRQRFSDAPTFTLIEGSILDTDLTQWGPIAVAGNLPYYITSPIIERVLRMGPALLQAVFLVQKEVAERLAAKPGTRDYGYLTVQAKLYAEIECLFGVPASAFKPPPKVESAVVRLKPHGKLPVPDPDEFLAFVGRCFQQKRKMLRNNLIQFYPRDLVDLQPEASLRAEQMPIEQFVDLYHRLASTACPS